MLVIIVMMKEYEMIALIHTFLQERVSTSNYKASVSQLWTSILIPNAIHFNSYKTGPFWGRKLHVIIHGMANLCTIVGTEMKFQFTSGVVVPTWYAAEVAPEGHVCLITVGVLAFLLIFLTAVYWAISSAFRLLSNYIRYYCLKRQTPLHMSRIVHEWYITWTGFYSYLLITAVSSSIPSTLVFASGLLMLRSWMKNQEKRMFSYAPAVEMGS